MSSSIIYCYILIIAIVNYIIYGNVDILAVILINLTSLLCLFLILAFIKLSITYADINKTYLNALSKAKKE